MKTKHTIKTASLPKFVYDSAYCTVGSEINAQFPLTLNHFCSGMVSIAAQILLAASCCLVLSLFRVCCDTDCCL